MLYVCRCVCTYGREGGGGREREGGGREREGGKGEGGRGREGKGREREGGEEQRIRMSEGGEVDFQMSTLLHYPT